MARLNIFPFCGMGLANPFQLFSEVVKIFPDSPLSICESMAASLLPRRALAAISRCVSGISIDRFEMFVALKLPSPRPVGFVSLYAFNGAKDDVWLGRLGVREDQRGFGFGRDLFAHAVQMAQKRGYQTLRLWTTDRPESERARGMYKNFGMIRQEVCAYLPPSATEGDAVSIYSLDLDGGQAQPFRGSLETATYDVASERIRSGRKAFVQAHGFSTLLIK